MKSRAFQAGRTTPLTTASPYITVLMIDLMIAALFAASLHFIMGPAGMHSFGHAAYFGLGAYAAALLMRSLDLPMEAALLAAPLAGSLRGKSARSEFWRQLEQIALAYAVAGASFAAAMASAGVFSSSDAATTLAAMALRGAVGVAAGLALAALRPGLSGRMAGAIIAGAGLVLPLAYALNDLDIPAAALFMVLWAGIAAAALKAGWRGVFQLAVGVIAARLIILSFELASDLLLSGFGLIAAGLLVLGVGWGALKVSRRFAPENAA